jgi:hypothetical protein
VIGERDRSSPLHMLIPVANPHTSIEGLSTSVEKWFSRTMCGPIPWFCQNSALTVKPSRSKYMVILCI